VEEVPIRVAWWIVLLMASSRAATDRPGVESLLAGAPCAAEVRGQLEAWDVQMASAIRDPDGPARERRVRLPTHVLGIWVRLEVAHQGGVTVTRVDALGMETHRFGTNCSTPQIVRQPHAERERTLTGFTDAALRTRLAAGDAGVILVWSPHMPLSVDALQLLPQVTADLALAFVPVLDPLASGAYAREVVTSRRLPSAALQTLASIELAFRGMTTHAPSMQLFAGGALVGPVVFGYRDAAGYRQILETLAAR
jgi:hypothetical protein